MNNNPLDQSFRITQSDKLLTSPLTERCSENYVPPKEKHFRLSMIALLSLLLLAVQAHANDNLEKLKPGEWYRFPNSQMHPHTPPNTREPNDPPNRFSYDWRFFSKGIMDAWGSGAYDTDKNRLIIWGGGHTDYVGNEVYAFNLEEVTSQGTGSWSRLTNPSSVPLNCDLRSPDLIKDTTPDACLKKEIEIMGGQPVSRHTYDSLEYLPGKKNVLWAQGGSRWPTGACSVSTWELNFNIPQNSPPNWIKKDNIPECSGVLTVFSAYDSKEKKVFSFGSNSLLQYDPFFNNGTWNEKPVTEVHSISSDKLTAAIDPVKRKMIVLGNLLGKNYVLSYDLSNIDNVQFSKINTTGDTDITKCNGPGFEYDSASQQLVAWCNTDDIYVLDIEKMHWSKQTPTSSLIAAPRLPEDSKGTYGRFRYVPKYNVFVLATGTQQDVYAYKRSTLDADGNGGKDGALTDGLLFMRYMFGLRGDALISGAVGAGCTRCTSTQIESYIKQVGEELRSDIDGNGVVDALTDGLLIIRYLFGIGKDPLIDNAIGDGCTRCTAPEITDYLGTLSTK